ncbi:MAG: hypothetical protein IJR72_00640 [Oscillospiraceae bacterium]|nr:hypothetical protein [Oscillospiraceae bacterium]
MSAFLSQLVSAALVLILLSVSGAAFLFMMARLTPHEKHDKTVVRRHDATKTP